MSKHGRNLLHIMRLMLKVELFRQILSDLFGQPFKLDLGKQPLHTLHQKLPCQKEDGTAEWVE